jgi:hypothetical protein
MEDDELELELEEELKLEEDLELTKDEFRGLLITCTSGSSS